MRPDVSSLLNCKDGDINGFEESRPASEPAGIEDIHFHPVEPLTVRGSVRVKF
jgi:hypothetical protein